MLKRFAEDRAPMRMTRLGGCGSKRPGAKPAKRSRRWKQRRPVRFIKAPLSLPDGEAFASGIVPPFNVPAVISPIFAVRAESVVVVISEALIVVASIIVDTILFDLICED